MRWIAQARKSSGSRHLADRFVILFTFTFIRTRGCLPRTDRPDFSHSRRVFDQLSLHILFEYLAGRAALFCFVVGLDRRTKDGQLRPKRRPMLILIVHPEHATLQSQATRKQPERQNPSPARIARQRQAAPITWPSYHHRLLQRRRVS